MEQQFYLKIVQYLLKHSIKMMEVVKKYLKFWDTIKGENYNNISPIHYKSSSGAIIVFDIINRSSFEKLDEIVKKV